MKPRNTNGWERLNCPFFTSVCRLVLSRYLEEQGFAEKETGPIGEIVYARAEVFLEIGYDAASCPDYLPSIVLGIGEQIFDEAGRLAGVPMWYVLPSGHPVKERTFRTEEDLERVLTEIKDQYFGPYARPLWLNRALLKQRISDFHSES